MEIDGIEYITEALDYATQRLEKHQGPLDQELNDLICGISLVNSDLELIHPNINQKRPDISQRVTELKQLSPDSIAITSSVATRVLSPPRKKRRSERVAEHRAAEIAKNGMRGIPNYSTNCFAISTYQLVRNNPPLYQAVFVNPRFQADPKTMALRAFDDKYNSTAPLTVQDMQHVRTQSLNQHGISSVGHQDANEVLSRVLLPHVGKESGLMSSVVTKRTLEFEVPKGMTETALEGMDNVTVLGQEDLANGKVKVRVLQTIKSEDRVALDFSLSEVPSGASFEEVVARNYTDHATDYHLESGVKTVEVSRDFQIKAADKVVVSLGRFNGRRAKLKSAIAFENGDMRLDSKGPHQVKGFIVHQGQSLSSGHYVEYQMTGNQWFLNNDSRSTPVSERDAFKAMEQAYVLYGERS